MTKKKPLQKLAKMANVAKVKAVHRVKPIRKSPDEAYEELFADVREAALYDDVKVFTDLVSKKPIGSINKEYAAARKQADFDLKKFVDDNFYEISHDISDKATVVTEGTARQYVRNLWPKLERQIHSSKGSLLALPHSYYVPGGRFSEQFYWDTYFIMLGLAAENDWEKIYGMIRNYSYMMSRLKLIPTANRTYFLSRSQPPFFALMVRLLSREFGKSVLVEFLPTMLAEHRFWMKGSKKALTSGYDARVVYMPDGSKLNRYFDEKPTPRPDVGGEDLRTANEAERDNKKLFTDIRAAAESGWDFSSRWFEDGKTMKTIVTTDIVPVDLNSLLYMLEMTIAETYRHIKLPKVAQRYEVMAESRKESIIKYCWNKKDEYFYDYNFVQEKQSPEKTLAGVFPLYANFVDTDTAKKVAHEIEKNFFKSGGLVTTLINTGQQWDYPNGWAPLQWIAIEGFRNYGLEDLAIKIRDAWLLANDKVFENYGKMVEKYDVINPGVIGGGGEYAPQDGFGWTNGVYAVLKDEQLNEFPVE